MSNIVEVLGSKKFFGSKNETLKTRLILEQPGKIRDEYNLFTNISQDDQFVKEKNENEKYKVYGTISPVISKKAYYRNTKLNIDKNVLDFTNHYKDKYTLFQTYHNSSLKSFKDFKEVHFRLIGKIDRASTLSLIFEALTDTILEDDDERILSFFIEGLQ